MYDKYKQKHHSMSVNKWRKEIEERFDIEAFGDKPTDKMEDALDQLEGMIDDNIPVDEINEFIRKIVLRWYKIGAIRGAAEMLKDLAWYELLPDDEDELKEKLSEPIDNDDYLFWKASLKYKTIDGETNIPKRNFSIPYDKILEKYEKIG